MEPFFVIGLLLAFFFIFAKEGERNIKPLPDYEITRDDIQKYQVMEEFKFMRNKKK